MSQSTGGYSPPSSTSGGSASGGSKTDAAKEQAAGVGQSAKDAGGHVASTATDQAKEVAGEAQRQARDLVGEARGQVSEQAGAQQQRAASGLRALSDELGQMAENSGQSGMATDMARQAADRTREVSQWLEQREPGALVDEVRRFARQRPGTFLVGAAVAGVLAGRLTKGAVAASHDEHADESRAVPADGTGVGYAAPNPAVAGAPVAAGTATPGGYTHGRDAVGERVPSAGPLAGDESTTGYSAGGGAASGFGSQGPVRP